MPDYIFGIVLDREPAVDKVHDPSGLPAGCKLRLVATQGWSLLLHVLA
jgi:hypothetical protein